MKNDLRQKRPTGQVGSERKIWIVKLAPAAKSGDTLVQVAEFGMVARDASGIWVKLQGEAKLVDRLSATLPGIRWQIVGDQLFHPGKKVPSGLVPDLEWHLIRDAIDLRVPRPSVAARVLANQRHTVQLVRGGTERPCGAILTTIENLAAWMENVSDSRLRDLNWLAEHHIQAFEPEQQNATGRCVVVGGRLPPVHGTLMVVEEGVFIPAGYCWEPKISSAQIRELFQVASGDFLLWESNYFYSQIEESSFVVLKRASIRSILHRGRLTQA